MDVLQIVEFLNSKPGYIKSSPHKLAEVLDIDDIDKCRKAQQMARRLDTKLILDEDARILIYDLETSYNIVKSWRVGYNINLPHYSVIKERAIICVSYKWLGEDEVYNITWDENQCDKFLLKQFIKVMNEADIIVAHNGDKFDLKWIRTRALSHGLTMLPYYQQHDTLKTARRYFNFNSNKLDYITQFLGFEGKMPTEPELWDKIILHKDPEALKEMVKYCNEDVRQLEKVYEQLVNWDKPKQHIGVLRGKPTYSSPISGTLNLKLIKIRTTAAGTIKRIMQDLDTEQYFEISNANYKRWIKQL